MTIEDFFTFIDVYENIKIVERTDSGSNILFQLSRRVNQKVDLAEIPKDLYKRMVLEIMGTKKQYQLLIIVS